MTDNDLTYNKTIGGREEVGNERTVSLPHRTVRPPRDPVAMRGRAVRVTRGNEQKTKLFGVTRRNATTGTSAGRDTTVNYHRPTNKRKHVAVT